VSALVEEAAVVSLVLLPNRPVIPAPVAVVEAVDDAPNKPEDGVVVCPNRDVALVLTGAVVLTFSNRGALLVVDGAEDWPKMDPSACFPNRPVAGAVDTGLLAAPPVAAKKPAGGRSSGLSLSSVSASDG